MNQILQDPLLRLTVISIAVGVTGIILAYVFHRAGQRMREPYWTIQSNNLIRDYSAALPDLEVLFSGLQVQNLTVSKIVFWNKGRETIHGEDIAAANPLRVVGRGDVKLLDTGVLKMNNLSSQVSIAMQPGRSTALLEFDYLDHKQGASLQVVHTGISSADISLAGDIKGARSLGKLKYGSGREPRAPIWSGVVGLALGGIAGVVATTITSGVLTRDVQAILGIVVFTAVAYAVVSLSSSALRPPKELASDEQPLGVDSTPG